MIGRLREGVQRKPWLGWVFALVLGGLAVLLYLRGGRSADPYSPERTTESVTIKFTDTGEELTMPRGRFEKLLRDQGELDASKGLLNPATKKYSGFLVDKDEWEETVRRINAERDALRQQWHSSPPASGSP